MLRIIPRLPFYVNISEALHCNANEEVKCLLKYKSKNIVCSKPSLYINHTMIQDKLNEKQLGVSISDKNWVGEVKGREKGKRAKFRHYNQVLFYIRMLNEKHTKELRVYCLQ